MTPLRALLDRRDRAVLMGIINRTPDSFSDGGRLLDDGAALDAAARMVEDGAEILDVGAESTRPGAAPVSAHEQIARIGTLIEKLVGLGALVSIDTTLGRVAEYALDQGASIVNSVSLAPAAELGELAARRGASLVLMHCRGSMQHMAGFSVYADAGYGDVVSDVAREWTLASREALRSLAPEDLVLDPGLGFTKNAKQSLELCARLDELVALGFPVLAGPSRKSFLARVSARSPEAEPAAPSERLGASIAASLACAARGAAILRVHDVAPVRQALAVAVALRGVSKKGTLQNAARIDRSDAHEGDRHA